MPAYMIAQVNITDPEAFKKYQARVPETLKPYGGTYIVRGGETTVLEGEMPYPRIVVIAFPSLDQAKAWHASDAYAEPLAIRQASADSVLIAVDGYDG